MKKSSMNNKSMLTTFTCLFEARVLALFSNFVFKKRFFVSKSFFFLFSSFQCHCIKLHFLGMVKKLLQLVWMSLLSLFHLLLYDTRVLDRATPTYPPTPFTYKDSPMCRKNIFGEIGTCLHTLCLLFFTSFEKKEK